MSVARRFVLLACVLGGNWLCVPSFFAGGTPPPSVVPALLQGGASLGFLVEPPDAKGIASAASVAAEHPVFVRLIARWADVESERGVYDWSQLDPAVGHLSGSGYKVVLCLTGTNPLYVEAGQPMAAYEPEILNGWTGFIRSAVRGFAGRVQVLEIWDRPAGSDGPGARGFDPEVYAFLLKNSALAARAEAKAEAVEILVAEGAIGAADLPWQEKLWEGDAAAYIDILPVRIDARDGGVAGALSSVFEKAVLHPPAPSLWAYLEVAQDSAPGESLARAVEALSAPAPASVALASIPSDPKARTALSRVALGLHGLLFGFAAAPPGDLSFVDLDQAPLAGARVLGRFLNDKDRELTTQIVYEAPPGQLANQQAWLILDTSDVRDARVVDPATGQAVATVPSGVPGRPGRKALRVLFLDHPMVLSFKRAALPEGMELPTEQLAVETRRGLTAEEVIARYQAVQKIQDDRLDRWTGKARLTYHFKLAQAGSTVDVSIDCNYFWERGARLEWEQTTYYVNGNQIRWKNIPELPLIQPEKVATLPLDLTLDKTYDYRLRGEDEVEGRAAYVLDFEPAAADTKLSLYRGRVWIDKTTFVRLKASTVETNLEPPVFSNEEINTYRPFTGPDGETHWMLTEVRGQQLWTVGGRNLVVNREIDFSSFEINPPKPTFDDVRGKAYASKNRMLQDTDQGLRYMQRQPDGTRRVKEKVDTHKWFAAAGAYKDDSRPNPIGGIGVNYLDYDFLKKDIQFNVTFLGVLAFVNLTDPALFGKRLDLAFDAVGVAVKGEDKVYENGEEIVKERIDTRSQYAAIRLGIPLSSFVKFTLIGSFYINQYFGNADAENALEGTGQEFVVPVNHRTAAATLQVEFNRRGYALMGSGTWAHRSDWEPWGLYNRSDGSFVDPEFDPEQQSYVMWEITAFKEWYFSHFQKLRVEADYLDGQRLDRFSRYSFGMFGGDRLSGFSGTGVRFDRGFVARAGYSFNLFGAVTLDVSADTARVKDKRLSEGYQRFTGAGLSSNFVGPWTTVIAVGYGRALASDIPELEGKQEFALLILKLF